MNKAFRINLDLNLTVRACIATTGCMFSMLRQIFVKGAMYCLKDSSLP